MQQMQQNIGRFGPDIEKFMYGMMMGGGKNNVSKLTNDMNQQYQNRSQDITNQVKASGIPMQSTAMARAMGDSLGKANTDYSTQLGQLQAGLMENAMGRQFQGAQGLMGMPSYYGQPTSIEQAIFGMRSPYDMANFDARMNTQNNMANWMGQYGMYQPERVQTPSPFDQYVSPLLNAGMQGFATALPFML